MSRRIVAGSNRAHGLDAPLKPQYQYLPPEPNLVTGTTWRWRATETGPVGPLHSSVT